MKCLLCQRGEGLEEVPVIKEQKKYYSCGLCGFYFLDPDLFLESSEEKQRYLTHENDVEDINYQAFMQPLVEAVIKNVPPGGRGLDFGSGFAPVLTKLLAERGYLMETYDLFFFPNKEVYSKEYDFVVASEVLEHLYRPLEELQSLRKLLKPGGILASMTLMLTEEQNFEDWFYRRDPTHVAFFSKQSFKWIKRALQFSSLEFFGQRVQLLRV